MPSPIAPYSVTEKVTVVGFRECDDVVRSDWVRRSKMMILKLKRSGGLSIYGLRELSMHRDTAIIYY